MCSPTLVFLAISATATLAQGYAAKQQGDFSAGVGRYNARVKENQATQTENLGVQQENVQREKVAQAVSRQRAAIASKGFDVNTGTAADIQESTKILGEADALRDKTNYLNQAEVLNQQAALSLAEGYAKQKAGHNAFKTSILSAAGTAILGAGVADKWFLADSAANATSTGGDIFSLNNGDFSGLRIS